MHFFMAADTNIEFDMAALNCPILVAYITFKLPKLITNYLFNFKGFLGC